MIWIIDLGVLILCFIGIIYGFLFLFDSTYPAFKYSLSCIRIITFSTSIASTTGLIIVIKSWRKRPLSTLSNRRKIIYSLFCLFLSFLLLSSIEYLFYINNKDKFNIENNYIKDSTVDKILNITKEIKRCRIYVDKYSHIYEELKNTEYLGYTNMDDSYFTVMDDDTIEINVHQKRPMPGTGSNGLLRYKKGLNSAVKIGISLKNEPYNLSHPTSQIILKTMQQNNCINGRDICLLVHQKIKMYQDRIKNYEVILEKDLVVTFGDFIIYSIFNPSITGNKTHIFIRLIFLLQAIVVTFFSGYIYQTLYKMLDGEDNKTPEA